MRFRVTIREVWTLATEEEADSPEAAERLAWENSQRAPLSAWRRDERVLSEIVEAVAGEKLHGV
jgi:hypothetical protein